MKIAEDEIFNEFCRKLQTRFLSHWVDLEIIPEIARECRDELISHHAEELDRRDRHAIESIKQFLLKSFTVGTIQKYISPQLLIMHLMMSMMSSFDTVMINYFTKGIMKRLVVHRSDLSVIFLLLVIRLVSVMYGLESRVNHVIEVCIPKITNLNII